MRIIDKLIAKQKDMLGQECVSIAFLGDSVTQGCFEVFPKSEGVGVVYDEEHSYHKCLNLDNYKKSLGTIFSKLKEKDIDVIFMTPNTMNMKISPQITDAGLGISQRKNAEFKKKASWIYIWKRHWKLLEQSGVDTTALLSNHINHPTREMSWLFAVSLFETILDDHVINGEEIYA